MRPTVKYHWVFLFAIIALFGSCSTEIDLFVEIAPKPIVYCMLNPADNYAYVTVTKSVRGKNRAHDLISDYKNIEVHDLSIRLEGWSLGRIVWESGFSRIDYQDTINIVHAFNRPLYRSDSVLRLCDQKGISNGHFKEFDHFRLIVSSSEFDEIAYARIPIFRVPSQKYPLYPMDLNLYDPDCHLEYNIDRPETQNAELICEFHFKEFEESWEEKSIQFYIERDIPNLNHDISIYFEEDHFFKKLKELIHHNPRVASRLFVSIDFIMLATDQYYDDYWSTYLNASETDNPNLGNITNGIGLFSLVRSYRYSNVKLSRRTMDSLCNGRLTRQLNFKDW